MRVEGDGDEVEGGGGAGHPQLGVVAPGKLLLPKLPFTFHSELAVNVVHRCNGYKVQFIWFALLALSDMGFTFSLTALTINTVAGIADSISWMYIGHWKFNICKFRPGAN